MRPYLGPQELIPIQFGLWMFFIMLHRYMVFKTLKSKKKKFCDVIASVLYSNSGAYSEPIRHVFQQDDPTSRIIRKVNWTTTCLFNITLKTCLSSAKYWAERPLWNTGCCRLFAFVCPLFIFITHIFNFPIISLSLSLWSDSAYWYCCGLH